MYNLSFTYEERDALLDALRKGASRHESYAKFYPGRSKSHREMAAVMNRLLKRISSYPAD